MEGRDTRIKFLIKVILQVINVHVFCSADRMLLTATVEHLIKDTLNKRHIISNLSIKDKFYSPYMTMAIHAVLPLKKDNLCYISI